MTSTLPIFGLAVLVLLPDAALAQAVKLPAIFRDHMVLQRDVSVPVWGRLTLVPKSRFVSPGKAKRPLPMRKGGGKSGWTRSPRTTSRAR